jgi:hypothetical protein
MTQVVEHLPNKYNVLSSTLPKKNWEEASDCFYDTIKTTWKSTYFMWKKLFVLEELSVIFSFSCHSYCY